MTGLLSGRLTVGMVTACTITGLFDALAAFHRAHPGVAITLLEDNSATLAERARSGAIDVALIGTAGGPPPELASFPIVSERLVAAVPHDHPYPERTRLTLADLAASPLICMPEGTGIRTVFDQAAALAGLKLPDNPRGQRPQRGGGPRRPRPGRRHPVGNHRRRHAARLRSAIITDVAIPADLSLIWKPPPTPAARSFLTHCRQAFPHHPPPPPPFLPPPPHLPPRTSHQLTRPPRSPVPPSA